MRLSRGAALILVVSVLMVLVFWGIAGADHGPVTFMQVNNLSDGTAILGVATGKRLTVHGGVGIWGRATGGSGRGVVGVATDTQSATVGVLGDVNSTKGFGVLGLSRATTGIVAGVRGESASQSGAGVWGISSAIEGGGGPLGHRPAGVRGEGSIRGVIGIATPLGAADEIGWGVEGVANGKNGIGVQGAATSTTGTAIGVKGTTASPSGWAILGEGPRGILGKGSVAMRAEGDHGIEVFGGSRGVDALVTGTTGIGVRGAASSTSGTTVGVLGQAYSPSGIALRAVGLNGARAGQFEGDVYILGGGHLFVHGNHVADLAEDLPLAGSAAAGDVVVLAPGRSYGVTRATKPYQVAGNGGGRQQVSVPDGTSAGRGVGAHNANQSDRHRRPSLADPEAHSGLGRHDSSHHRVIGP